MGTLRPTDPKNHDRIKPYDEYSKEERIHAVVQIEDDHKNAAHLGRELSPETVDLAHRLAKGTDKEGHVDIPQSGGAGVSRK